MSLSIEGIRLTSLSLKKNDEGHDKITGGYELITPTGATLAKQDFNSGYGGNVEVPFSQNTMKLANQLRASVVQDINNVFGME